MIYYHAELGEHDPAHRYPTAKEERYCNWQGFRVKTFVCTLIAGHTGPHVAHIAARICAIQDDWLPDELRVPEGL